MNMRLDEFELVERMIASLDEEIRPLAALDPKARLLDTLPGVPPYTTLFLSSTIDDVNRFVDSKHLCAFLGLVPSLYQSGDVCITGYITKISG